MEYRHTGLFGGQGDVWVHDLLNGPAPTPFTSALWCRLAPGGSVGRHSQQTDAELVVVTSGQGVGQVDDVDQPLLPGVVLRLPLGSTLALQNTDLEHPLEYLIVKASPQEGPAHKGGIR